MAEENNNIQTEQAENSKLQEQPQTSYAVRPEQHVADTQLPQHRIHGTSYHWRCYLDSAGRLSHSSCNRTDSWSGTQDCGSLHPIIQKITAGFQTSRKITASSEHSER